MFRTRILLRNNATATLLRTAFVRNTNRGSFIYIKNKKFQRFYSNGTEQQQQQTTGREEKTHQEKTERQKKTIKQLIHKYGYSALIVYVGLCLIDFPLAFMAVHSLGEETIGKYINRCKRLFGYGNSDEEQLLKEIREKRERRLQNAEEHIAKNWKENPLLAELLLSYGIHKALIVARIPLTAAITPSAARVLARFGVTNQLFTSTATRAPLKYPNAPIATRIPPQHSKHAHKWFNGLF